MTKKIVYVLKFIGTVSVTVTFLTVVLFLAPFGDWGIMLFQGPNLVFHVIVPILAIVT